MRNFVVAITVLVATGVACATTTVPYWPSIHPMAGGTAYDFYFSSDCDWTNGRIWVELTAGSLIDPIAFNSHITGFNDADTWVDAASPSDANTSVIVNSLEGNEVLDWSWYDATTDGAQTWLAARIIVTDDAVGFAYGENYDVSAPGVPQPWPEPATVTLLAFGGLALLRRRRLRGK